MPPKKITSQEILPNKTIKVKKLDSIKINKPEIIPEIISEIIPNSIIKSNVKITEPIVEIINNDEQEQDLENPARKEQDLENPARKLQDLENPARKFSTNNNHEDEQEDEQDIINSSDNDNDTNIKSTIKHKKESKIYTNDSVKPNKTSINNIESKKDKVHNHSKPKTIIASSKDVNTVDMFGEDDLDFRYVMMNYDYTKNVSMPKITKYERALLIGKRAKQIEEGANPNVKYISGQSVVSIAEEELRQRKIPLIIKRPIGNKFEYWKPADMEVNMD